MNTAEKSIWPKVGITLGMEMPEEKSGITLKKPISALGTYRPVSSQAMPSSQVMRMPQRIPPLTFLTIRTAVISTPMMASRTVMPSVRKVSAFLLKL